MVFIVLMATSIGYVINKLLMIIVPIICLPFTWILSQIESNSDDLYKLRYDMILQGLVRGLLIFYLLVMFYVKAVGEVEIIPILTSLIRGSSLSHNGKVFQKYLYIRKCLSACSRNDCGV